MLSRLEAITLMDIEDLMAPAAYADEDILGLITEGSLSGVLASQGAMPADNRDGRQGGQVGVWCGRFIYCGWIIHPQKEGRRHSLWMVLHNCPVCCIDVVPCSYRGLCFQRLYCSMLAASTFQYCLEM